MNSMELNIIIGFMIILMIILICNKTNEGFASENSTSNEAVQSVASVFNENNMSVSNLTVTSTLNIVPKGSIIMWSGATAPDGWALCDGQNETPDLRGRFVRMWNDDGFDQKHTWHGGATEQPVSVKSSSATDSLRNGKRGYANSYLMNHAHGDRGGSDVYVLDTYEIPSHTHPYVDAYFSEHWGNDTANPNLYGTGSKSDNDNKPYTLNRTTSATGSGGGHSTQPPYHVLSFIMKL